MTAATATKTVWHWWAFLHYFDDASEIDVVTGCTPGILHGTVVYFDESVPHFDMRVQRLGLRDISVSRNEALDRLIRHLGAKRDEAAHRAETMRTAITLAQKQRVR